MNNKEKKQFNQFKNEVLKYEIITIEDLHMLLRRFTNSCNRNLYYFKSKNPIMSRVKAQSNYYRFWIKMLENMKIIQQKGIAVWKVNNEEKNC